MPNHDSSVEAAMTMPLRAAAGRCWMMAFTGTLKKPQLNPSRPRFHATPLNVSPGLASSPANSVRPAMPSGIKPYSIFCADT